MLTANIAHNGLVKGIACNLQRRRHGNAVHAQHRDIRGAAADIHHHVAIGVFQVQSRAQARSQGLLNEEHSSGTGLDGGIDDVSLLNFRHAAGHADDHTGLGGKERGGGGGFEHLAEHFDGHLVIGDDAILQRAHGHHVAGGTVQHISGRRAYLQNLAGIPVHSHHRGLPDHQALAVCINKNIGCTQVNAQVIGK